MREGGGGRERGKERWTERGSRREGEFSGVRACAACENLRYVHIFVCVCTCVRVILKRLPTAQGLVCWRPLARVSVQ